MNTLMVRNLVTLDGPMQLKIEYDDDNLTAEILIENQPTYRLLFKRDKPQFFKVMIRVILGETIIHNFMFSPYLSQLAATVKSNDPETIRAFAEYIKSSLNTLINDNERFYEIARTHGIT